MATDQSFLVSLAEAALASGFVPIAVEGKKPLLPRWQQTSAQTALRKIKTATNADNIGILTGKPSGVVVVDVDLAKGGLDYWNSLLKEHSIGATFTVETGGGGRHYYFSYDDRTSTLRNATGAIKKYGIDFKGDGGQVVFAGSIHPDTGSVYTIIDGHNEDSGEIVIAPMPGWLFELLQSNQEQLNDRYPHKYRK